LTRDRKEEIILWGGSLLLGAFNTFFEGEWKASTIAALVPERRY
jgi:hypothetical protein